MVKTLSELDEIKASMERLTAEYHTKTALSESLKRALDEQRTKFHVAKVDIEKQAQELNAKQEEISLVRQMYEDLKSSLHEKESNLRHLSSTNDQLRNACDGKVQKLEEENRELLHTLDEANAKLEDQDQRICAYRKEIEGLTGLLSVSQKKCADAEQRAKAPIELQQRDDLLVKLEQENGKVVEQLKWRNEQFKHLEEALEKLQDKFQAGMNEWKLEKSTLVDEICSLQTNLEVQHRVSEGLRSELQMCNQALAHEESRWKLLELQVSEMKLNYNSVAAEYKEARSAIESLTVGRDEEVAGLRASLAEKETVFKEMDFRRVHLEHENQELRGSLKELQEAQINQAGSAASLTKLRQRLQRLEQVHKACSVTLKEREAEWSSQSERLQGDLDECQLNLNSRDNQIKELQIELEECHSSMTLLHSRNEEISTMLMVLKSKLLMPHLEVKTLDSENELYNEKKEEKIISLTEELEKKNSALVEAQLEIEREHEMTASLLRRIELSDSVEQQYLSMKKDLERYKEMLEASSKYQDHLKEQASQREVALRDDLRKVSDALDKANCNLAEEKQEGREMKIHLERCKLSVEQMKLSKQDTEGQLKKCQEQILQAQKEVETAILAKIEMKGILQQGKERLHLLGEEKDKKINDLQGQIQEIQNEIEVAILAKMESERTLQQVTERSHLLVEEKNKRINDLQSQIYEIQKEVEAVGLAKMETEGTLKQVKESFLLVIEEKETGINDLQRQIQEIQKEMEAAILSKMKTEATLQQVKESLLLEREEKDKRINDLQDQIVFMEQELVRREKVAATLTKEEVTQNFMQERGNFIRITEEKDERLADLQCQVVFLEQECTRRVEEASNLAKSEAWQIFNQEKESFLHTAAENEKRLDDLQRQIILLEEESFRRKTETAMLATLENEKAFAKEKESFVQSIEEKDKRINDLQRQVLQEKEFIRSLEVTFNSEIVGKQSEINALHKAWDKISLAYVLSELQVHCKSILISEMETDIETLKLKLTLAKKSLSGSKQKVEQLETELKMEQRDKESVTDQLKDKMLMMESTERTLYGQNAELQAEIKKLHEVNTKLFVEKDELLCHMGGFCDRIGEFWAMDVELMRNFPGTIQLPANEDGPAENSEEDEHISFNKNENTVDSTSKMKTVESPNWRSPLKDLNS